MKAWLKKQLAYVESIAADPDPQPADFDCLREIVREAERRAAEGGLPAAVAACKMRPGPITPSIAREALAACQDTPSKNEMLSIAEAARILGRSESGIRKLIRRKAIRFSQERKNSAIRFRREWLQDFIETDEPEEKLPRQRRGVAKVNRGGFGFDAGL